jgi:hypothetical protein
LDRLNDGSEIGEMSETRLDNWVAFGVGLAGIYFIFRGVKSIWDECQKSTVITDVSEAKN